MCLNVYVATARPEPLVEWDDHAPGFFTEDARFYNESRRPLTHQPNLYYCGSSSGCGCAFVFPDGSTEQERKDSERSLAGLRSFVLRTADWGAVEVRLCWAGDEREEPSVRARLSTAEFAEPAVLGPFLKTAWTEPVHLVVTRSS